MNRLTFGILVMITTALMGSSFAIGKIAITYISPLLLNALRFIVAGAYEKLVVNRSHRPLSNDWRFGFYLY